MTDTAMTDTATYLAHVSHAARQQVDTRCPLCRTYGAVKVTEAHLTADIDVYTCRCRACDGLSFTAPAAKVVGDTDRQRTELIHTLAQYAHGTSPLSQVMRNRYNVMAVTA
jgi:cytochrome c553